MLSGTWQETDVYAIHLGLDTMMLLPNGTVLAKTANQTNTWYTLTPDASGSYVNGTWAQAGSMNFTRQYFASNVLSNDKVFLVGGEYSNATTTTNGSITNTAEMYDMATNTWTNVASVPSSVAGSWSWNGGLDSGTPFGDDPSAVLPNGKILCGFIFDNRTLMYDPVANTWSRGPDKLDGDRSDEEGFVKLNNGNILDYDIFAPGKAQMFVPSANGGSGEWIETGAVPPLSLTSTSLGSELGAGTLLPNGKVLYLGATGHTAIYTPGPTNMDPGSWVQGPDILNASNQLMGTDDAPASVLSNGHVRFTADSVYLGAFHSPTEMFDYDPVANTITAVTSSTDPSLLNTNAIGQTIQSAMFLDGLFAYQGRMLVLPNGQMMFASGVSWNTSNGSETPVFFYTPSGSPQFSWRPSIVGITSHGGGSFTMTGTQLTGMSEGAAYGDDAEMSENYPIVQLRSSTGTIYFATTSNWNNTGVQTASQSVSTDFKLPAGIPAGNYLVTVSASGISSLPQGLHIGASDLPPGASLGTASPTNVVSSPAGSSSTPVPMPNLSQHPDGAIFGWQLPGDPGANFPFLADIAIFETLLTPTFADIATPAAPSSLSMNNETVAATDALFGSDLFGAGLYAAASYL